MSTHSFDPEIAAQTKSILSAVIYENIKFWIEKNEANEKHFHEGQYWTYNSKKAFSKLFPYVSSKQIRTALDKLIEHKLIVTGNFNKTTYDRTLWYGLYGLNHLPSEANGGDLFGQPIPDINTDNKPIGKVKMKAHRLPEGWMPPNNLTDFYLERGLTPATVKDEYEGFCDYWRSIDGPKARKLDWVMTWRNWIRRNHKVKGASNAKKSNNGNGSSGRTSALAKNSDRRRDAMQRNLDRNG